MHNPPHPGKVLRELYFKPLKITVEQAAVSLGVTRKTISFLLNEKSRISTAMAIRLGAAFANNPLYWLNLQQQYNVWQTTGRVNTANIKPLLNQSA